MQSIRLSLQASENCLGLQLLLLICWETIGEKNPKTIPALKIRSHFGYHFSRLTLLVAFLSLLHFIDYEILFLMATTADDAESLFTLQCNPMGVFSWVFKWVLIHLIPCRTTVQPARGKFWRWWVGGAVQAQILLFVNRICLHPCVYGLGNAGLCLMCRIIPLATAAAPGRAGAAPAPHMGWNSPEQDTALGSNFQGTTRDSHSLSYSGAPLLFISEFFSFRGKGVAKKLRLKGDFLIIPTMLLLVCVCVTKWEELH